MKNLRLFCLFVVLIPITVFADYYKYVDKNGGIHYVDDMSKIPEEYQKDSQRYASPDDVGDSGPDSAKNSESNISGDVQDTSQEKVLNEKNNPKEDKGPSKSALLKSKKELEEEYASLMKEKEALSQSIQEWTKRYKTRRRKSVARAKLKELEAMEMQWEEKYKAWEKKKMALERN